MNPKILVLRFSSLGDVILTTPVYRTLKKHMPDCRITVAVKDQYALVLEGNPNVDEILPLGKNESIFAFSKRVKQEKFDILIDLHNNLRSHIVSLLSGIPKILRYKKAFWERRLFVRNKIKNPELERHTIHRYLDALKPLGFEPEFSAPEIFPGKDGVPNARELRLLVVQTAFLGDAVLTTPMFSAARKTYPTAKISVLCTPETKEIFYGNPDVYETLVMDKRGKEKDPFSIFRWARALRGKFDVAILPHRSFRSALLVWLAGIPKRIGFNTSQGKIFLTDTVNFDWKTHDSERNLKLLEALGIKKDKPEIRISLGDYSAFYQNFIKENAVPENAPLVGMNAGSVWNTKRWLPEYFAAVADRLIEEKKCKVILFGSNKDAESARHVVMNMKNDAINLCGKTDLKTLSYLISKCSLFITNDSGPMHLACAANVPVVAIFGPTTRELGFFPYGEKSVVVELPLPCRPCSLHGGKKCPLGHFKCMKDLTPDMVIAPCLRFLSPVKS